MSLKILFEKIEEKTAKQEGNYKLVIKSEMNY